MDIKKGAGDFFHGEREFYHIVGKWIPQGEQNGDQETNILVPKKLQKYDDDVDDDCCQTLSNYYITVLIVF